MRRHRVRTVLAVLGVSTLLSGCSDEVVRAETRAAIQRVIDVSPEGSDGEFLPEPVSQLGEDSIGCGGSGVPSGAEGVSHTNHIVVAQSDGFDAHEFFDGLPAELNEAFTVTDTSLGADFPAVDIVAAHYGNTRLSLSSGEMGGERYVQIYVFSRCGQAPAE